MYLFSVSVLLVILLVLSGCPASTGGETESDPGIAPQEVPSSSSTGGGSNLPIPEPIKLDAAALVAGAGEASDAVTGTLATATAPVVLEAASATTVSAKKDNPLEVPANKVLELGANVSLGVANGDVDAVSSTVLPGVTIAGTLNVKGGAVVDFREVENTKTGAITVSGTITVEDGGAFYSPVSAGGNANETPQLTYGATGKTVLKWGSKVYMHLVWGSAFDIFQIGPADDDVANRPAIYQWASSSDSGTREITQDDDGENIITLKSGVITTYGMPVPFTGTASTWEFAGIQKGVINQGATLVVAGTKGLQVDKELTVNGTLTAAAAAPIVADSGIRPTITFGSTATLNDYFYDGSTIFYKSDGSRVTAITDLRGKTFKWDGAVPASGTWEETP
jgi:hypothetical protein